MHAPFNPCRFSRLPALCAGALLALCAAAPAQAQSVPVLTCAPGATTATPLNLSTGTASWTFNYGAGASPALPITPNPAWNPSPPAPWIGSNNTPAAANQLIRYATQFSIDPRVKEDTISITYNFNVDDSIAPTVAGRANTGIYLNNTSVGYTTPNVNFNAANVSGVQTKGPFTVPVAGASTLEFRGLNFNYPFGLAASVTINASCNPTARQAAVSAVPVNSPVALLSLAAVLGAAGAAVVRRRRK